MRLYRRKHFSVCRPYQRKSLGIYRPFATFQVIEVPILMTAMRLPVFPERFARRMCVVCGSYQKKRPQCVAASIWARGPFCSEKIVCVFVAFCRPGSDLLSRVLRRSTIGAGAFHGRVRNGNGCSRPAITTRSAKRNMCIVIHTLIEKLESTRLYLI